MGADAKDHLIRELKDSVSEQRQMNKTLRAALKNINAQVAKLTVQIRLLNEQLDYNKVKDIRRYCCFAHIRRHFFDAIPKGKQRDISIPAVQGIEYCDKLFAYERHFKEKGYSYRQIKNGCLKHEKPVIEAFLVWLDKQAPVKGSKFAATVNHALNRRDLMMTYLEDGRCSLSNNLSEQKMKSFVTGRKGWLFCDTPEGAKASAIGSVPKFV